MNVQTLTEDGGQSRELELREELFGAKVNVPLMHQVVTAQLAAARSGTHSTKTRAEVRGGGRKPWRQKGTGRARHGSIREPQWVGGGIAFGPKPRDYSFSVPKKMKALALRSALSDRAREQKLLVVEDLEFEAPKTKRARKALELWGVEGKVLMVLSGTETNLAYSFRNLPEVHLVAEHQLNVYDVLNAGTVIFTASAIEAFQSRALAMPGRRSGIAETAIQAGQVAETDVAAETTSGDAAEPPAAGPPPVETGQEA